ncbi:MAG: hypothetical protein GY833_23160 [Aestuariibacter sp.]|nr:hypothetical protein [Aestuariibacter sp.]|tara:strand:+ start:164939 stop:165169 length:231 start_codon:yes stop_codon:yes gene_type:complete
MSLSKQTLASLQDAIKKFNRRGWAIIGLRDFTADEIKQALAFFHENHINAQHVTYNVHKNIRERLPHNGVLKIQRV